MSGVEKEWLTCDFCGEWVRPPEGKSRRVLCPNCGRAVPVPRMPEPLPPPSPSSKPVQPIPVDPDLGGTQDDDDQPYRLKGERRYQCPQCHRLLEPRAVFCVGCGLNFQTGQRATRSFEPLSKRWVNGMSLANRMIIFLAGQAFFVPLAIYWSIQEGNLLYRSWFFFTLLTAFLLGTFDQIDLNRDARGRVKVTKLWRFCFFALPPKRIPMEDFVGLTTGMDHDAAWFEKLILLIGLMSLIIPGILWWLLVMERPVYFLNLTKEHGMSDLILYRGRSQETMQDMAAVLTEAGGLRTW